MMCTKGDDVTEFTLGDDPEIFSSASVNVASYTISGLKFEDLNANGHMDEGETGLKDWTIYIDTNNDGQLDSEETSTKTDASGAWSFANLNPGDYVVREVNPSGWHCSAPSPCEFDVHFNVRDEDRTDLRFGNWHDASVAGVKFHDRDGDGAA